jgi:glyoxylase-like metal-dependent hydrolase (beta-lactamase superfamily II)
MAEVKVIIEGWINSDCKKLDMPLTTACTISLVRDGDIIALVDPGELPDQKILIDALEKENLNKDGITHIFQTHYHIDHTRNTGLFGENVKIVNEFGEWQNGADKEMKFPVDYSKDIQIIDTPGHSNDGLTFLIKTEQGLVAVCGDVFWKQNYPKQDPYAKDMDELLKSRKKVMEIADFVIPGHGNIFKVKK